MSERETVTGPEPEPSALAWAERWLQSEQAQPVLGPPTMPDEPATHSLPSGADSTDGKTSAADVGPLRFDEYEVLEKIGEGGMGAVFQVRNLHLKRFEALKVITPRHSASSTARVRFEREFQALGKIAHPNIVTVYHTGVWHGHAYFTMKYVPGGALSRHLDRLRADPAAVARLMAKVARAVEFLHREQVLHRDLKPHNILLGDGDEPLVADFGLVKHLDEDSDASVTGAPMGTRPYMSPEQTFAQKADYTPGCDIWAMGVILYELLAGRRPFDHKDPVELYSLIRAAKPTAILELNPAAPGPLAAVAHRCLAKSPADRYPSAAAVADDLEAWLSGEAVTATYAPPVGHPSRRRWRWAAAGVGSAVVATVVAWPHLLPPPTVSPDPVPPPHSVADAVPLAPMPRPVLSPVERLARGEAIEFVGPTGGIRFPHATVPGSAPGGVEVDASGRLVLGSVGFLGVELFDRPIPPGSRLEAELVVTATRDTTSWAGLFVGGAEWATQNGKRSSLVQLIQTTVPRASPEGLRHSVRTGLELLRWRDRPPGLRYSHPVWEQVVADAPRDATPNWHRVAVTVWPGHVEATWDGVAVPTLDGVRATTILAEDGVVTVAGPFGPRVGLAVNHAGAAFRNVRLVPPPAP